MKEPDTELTSIHSFVQCAEQHQQQKQTDVIPQVENTHT